MHKRKIKVISTDRWQVVSGVMSLLANQEADEEGLKERVVVIRTTELELLSDWSAAGHLVGAGEGGAERLELRWEESALSVEWERV